MFICAVISEFLWDEHRLSDVSITIYITIFMNKQWLLNDYVKS